MKKFTLSLLLIFVWACSWAAQGKVLFYGYVTEGDLQEVVAPSKKAETKTLNEVTLNLFEDGELTKTLNNRNSGFYAFILKAGKDYEVEFVKKGFITKKVSIKAAEIPNKEYDEAFKMFTDITLFPEMEGKDFTDYSKRIIARCMYNSEKDRMSWDMEYAQGVWGIFLDMTGVLTNDQALTKDE
ncbi:MAG: hypothetical protein AAF193_01945 [Bacteroidota bacterium]